MRTKKFLAGAVASLMLAAAMPTVMAADSFEVAISNTTAKAGEDFTLTLDMSEIPAAGINGCDFGIQYDSSVLTITDLDLGDLAKGDSSEVDGMPDPFEYNIEDDLISVIYGVGTTDTNYYMTGSGTLLTISGTVNSTAAAGTKSELKVVAIDRTSNNTVNTDAIFANYDANGTVTLYTPVFTDGYVEVTSDSTEDKTEASIEFGTPTKLGDVNNDSQITSTDVVLLNKYLLSTSEYPLEGPVNYANADCITNQILDLEDSSAITSYVLGTFTEDDFGPKE
ncbi:cohesin domain-containing protein [Porcipelethomonas sp.]|uniref:cohesin domain-containing protein n=1 Tax=Porcipelethomonas sp. TaxID=2981675 RepID=UPI003EF26FAA